MRDLILLFVHVLATSIRLARPGGVRSVLAESVLLKHQLLILNRSRRRAPNLRASDRLIAGLCALFVLPRRLVRSAVVMKPSTLLNFHNALVRRKYRLLFSPKHRAKPGPKGPSLDLIRAVIEMKQRNPRWGCPSHCRAEHRRQRGQGPKPSDPAPQEKTSARQSPRTRALHRGRATVPLRRLLRLVDDYPRSVLLEAIQSSLLNMASMTWSG